MLNFFITVLAIIVAQMFVAVISVMLVYNKHVIKWFYKKVQKTTEYILEMEEEIEK